MKYWDRYEFQYFSTTHHRLLNLPLRFSVKRFAVSVIHSVPYLAFPRSDWLRLPTSTVIREAVFLKVTVIFQMSSNSSLYWTRENRVRARFVRIVMWKITFTSVSNVLIRLRLMLVLLRFVCRSVISRSVMYEIKKKTALLKREELIFVQNIQTLFNKSVCVSVHHQSFLGALYVKLSYLSAYCTVFGETVLLTSNSYSCH